MLEIFKTKKQQSYENKDNKNLKEFSDLLNNKKFKEAKDYIDQNGININYSKTIGTFLKNLMKDPEDFDFRDLNSFLESNILPADKIKNNLFIFNTFREIVRDLEKDKNYKAISRLKNLGLIDYDLEQRLAA